MYETWARLRRSDLRPCWSRLRTLSRRRSASGPTVRLPEASRIVTPPTVRSETGIGPPLDCRKGRIIAARRSRAAAGLRRDADGRVAAARPHVDVVHGADQPVGGITFLLRHHFLELGIVVSRLQTLVARVLRRVSANVDERALGADS